MQWLAIDVETEIHSFIISDSFILVKIMVDPQPLMQTLASKVGIDRGYDTVPVIVTFTAGFK